MKWRRKRTGVNATAFGLGLNDVALTFNLFAAATSSFADSALLEDCELAPDPEAFVVACVAALDCCDPECDFLPLKGGIGWMTMLILAPLGAVTGVLVPTTEGLLTSFEDELVPDTLPEVDVATLLEVAGAGGFVAGVALSAAVAPMVRACVEVASLVDFSIIARCFSSSLARIFTRSSGMGLFNWKQIVLSESRLDGTNRRNLP